jgi:hypothetical protein
MLLKVIICDFNIDNVRVSIELFGCATSSTEMMKSLLADVNLVNVRLEILRLLLRSSQNGSINVDTII